MSRIAEYAVSQAKEALEAHSMRTMCNGSGVLPRRRESILASRSERSLGFFSDIRRDLRYIRERRHHQQIPPLLRLLCKRRKLGRIWHETRSRYHFVTCS